MVTQQVQIKLNLPLALKEFLESKAQKFDMPIAGYVRHLILNDVSDLDFPTFQISAASEKKAQEAMEQIDDAVDASDFFKQLNES
jgi:hypothetical protein